MGDMRSSGIDKYVCPNDRQLALRAKLGTGWSVHTNRLQTYQKPSTLSKDEQETITKVIKKAEMMEHAEQERIGRLVERMNNMRKNSLGNGTTQCILCGDEFGLLGASPTYCDDCRKMWKKTGAWFFKGLPQFIAPTKKTDSTKFRSAGGSRRNDRNRAGSVRNYNTWSRGRGTFMDSGSETESSSSEDEVAIGRKRRSKKPTSDSLSVLV